MDASQCQCGHYADQHVRVDTGEGEVYEPCKLEDCPCLDFE